MQLPMKPSVLPLLVLAGLAGIAHATPQKRLTYVDVDRIEAVRDGNRLTVDLEIDPGSWRWLRRHQVEPVLHVQLGDRGAERAYPISDASSHLRVEVDSRSDAATVWITGEGRRTSVGWMKIGELRLYSLELRVRNATDRLDHQDDEVPPPPPPPPPSPARVSWAKLPEVIRACGGSQDTSKCLAAAAQPKFNPTPVMKACSARTSTYALTSECIDIAVTAETDPTVRLGTCFDVTSTYGHSLRCLKASVRARFEPTRAIKACQFATSTVETMLQCIELVPTAAADPTDVVNACKDSTRRYDQLVPCIKQALAH